MASMFATDLTVRYGGNTVLDGLRLEMEAGEIVGLVGQSGSGKSTLSLSILRLIDRLGGTVSGRILLDGEDLMALPEKKMRRLRGKSLALVSQNAGSSLNPALKLEGHFSEAWRAHSDVPWKEKRAEVVETLRQLDLPAGEEFFRRYPGQISVGQAQRVLIALAMLHRPRLLIADELTSALDLVTSAEALQLLRRANRLWGTAILFVSHDLGAVMSLCHRVAILHRGQIVENAPVTELLEQPRHDYTRQLLALLESTRANRAAPEAAGLRAG